MKAVDIVTADGQLRHASADENPDLYWAVRGGGGNFGVVTNFEFGLHPMQREVIAGAVVFPIERARELLAFYGEYSTPAPDELLRRRDRVGRRAGARACSSWRPSGRARRPTPSACSPRSASSARRCADTIKAWDYVALQRSTDDSDPRNEGTYLKSGFIDDYAAELPAAITDGFRADPKRDTVFFFQHSGGAIGRVAADATAFPHRRATHNMLSLVTWNLDDDAKPHMDYLRGYWPALERFTDGYYTNETADEGQRGRGRQLPGQPAPAARDQEEVRPEEPVPPERERPARLISRSSSRAPGCRPSRAAGRRPACC